MTKGTITPAMLGAYAENLETVEEGTLVEMFQLAEKKCKFFPTVAELLELVGLDDEDPDQDIRQAQRVYKRDHQQEIEKHKALRKTQ